MSENDNNSVIGARYSAIHAMHECRKSAWLIYGLKQPGFKNHFAKLGIVIHNVLEDYGAHCIENNLETDYSKFDELKFKHLNYLEEHQIKEAVDILNKIKENVNWSGILQFPNVTIEKRYRLDKNFNKIEDMEGSYLSGGIDLTYIDGDTAYVEDYKTVRAIYTDAFMRDALQSKVYAALIFANHPEVNTVKFAFNFVRYGYKSKYYEYYRENLDELNALLKSEIEALYELLGETNEPEASPSGYCQLCEVRGNCSAYQNAYDLDERLETDEQAIMLYQKYRLAEVKMKEAKELIKSWIETHDTIKLKGAEYGPVTEEKEIYPDTQKVIDILKNEYEIPEGAIFDALSFSKTSLNKILTKFKIKKDNRKSIDKIKMVEKTSKWKEIKIEEEQQDDGDNEVVYDRYV